MHPVEFYDQLKTTLIEFQTWNDPLSVKIRRWGQQTLAIQSDLDARISHLVNEILITPLGRTPLHTPMLLMSTLILQQSVEVKDMTFEKRVLEDIEACSSCPIGSIIAVPHRFAEKMISLVHTSSLVSFSDTGRLAIDLSAMDLVKQVKFDHYVKLLRSAMKIEAILADEQKYLDKAQEWELLRKNAEQLTIPSINVIESERAIDALEKSLQEVTITQKNHTDLIANYVAKDQATTAALQNRDAAQLQEIERLKAQCNYLRGQL